MVALPIAALAITMIALLLLLLSQGAAHAGQSLGQAIKQLGVPGFGIVGNAIAAAARFWGNLTQTILAGTVQPVIDLIVTPVTYADAVIGRIVVAFDSVFGTLEWLARTAIPHLRDVLVHLISEVETRVIDYAYTLYLDAVALTSAVETRVIGYAYALYLDAVALTSAVETRVIGYAYALYLDAVALTSAVETRVIGYAYALYLDAVALTSAVEVRLTGLISAVETRVLDAAAADVAGLAAQLPGIIATTATEVIGITATDIDNVIAPDLTGIIDDAGGVIGAIASDFPDIGSLLKSVDLTKVTDVAGELGLSVALSRVAARYLRDCGIPNCRNLGKFGRDLQALFGVVEDGALFTLLAALITDPADTVRPLHDFLAPIASDAITATRDLVGV